MTIRSVISSVAVLMLQVEVGAAQVAPREAMNEAIRAIDHYVSSVSVAPAIAGQTVQIYVRERVAESILEAGSPPRVVLFVHGQGTPAEVAFDVPYADYSWMEYLARAGFDVFSMEMTGYGRSTRPFPMNDPCNVDDDEQETLKPHPITQACPPSYPHVLTTAASDWKDLEAAADYVMGLRNVDRISLVAWSAGGGRVSGYATKHPDRVERIVLLAPAYGRNSSSDPPATLPANGLPMGVQTEEAFDANWDRQVGCSNQVDPRARDAVWSSMLDSDPVGATWGTGVRRAPNRTNWGFNAAAASSLRMPILLVAGIHDAQVSPNTVRQFYEDLGSTEKVFIDLGCSSHNAMWERNHLLMFEASLEWLSRGTVEGMRAGELRMGY